jgi:hypothetical protein
MSHRMLNSKLAEVTKVQAVHHLPMTEEMQGGPSALIGGQRLEPRHAPRTSGGAAFIPLQCVGPVR